MEKKTFVVYHLENDMHVPLAPDYTVCGFISEIMLEFVFSLHDTRIKCHTGAPNGSFREYLFGRPKIA